MRNSIVALCVLLIPSIYQIAQADNATPDCHNMSANYSITYLDENADGKITLDEYLHGDPGNQKKVFEHLDGNHDGMLDKAEQDEIEQVYTLIHQGKKPAASKTSFEKI